MKNTHNPANLILLVIAFLLSGISNQAAAEQKPVLDKIAELRSTNAFAVETKIFSAVVNSNVQLTEVVRKYQVLKANTNLAALLISQPEYLKLNIPDGSGTANLSVLLYKVNISPNGFTLLTSEGRTISSPNTVVHYRGSLENDPQSLASFTFSESESMGMVHTHHGNFVIGKIDKNPDGLFMVYNDKDLVPHLNFDCATNVSIPQGYTQKGGDPATQTTKCVNWYWEVDYDIFLDKDSVSIVNSYMQGIFNQVSTLYANDGISIGLQTLYVWTSVDPYTGPSTSNYLTQFGAYRTSFAGDLANLIGYQGGGGIAYIDGVCATATQYKMGYNGINSWYNTVPTYSWTVEVVAHEEGHLLGSRHTHDCVWNGNNTRIDNCGQAAGYSSGSCAAGPIPVKGTIMSYCHLNPNPGIDLSLGFGPQPKALMIDNINTASCLSACGTGCAAPLQPGAITGSASTCSASAKTYSVAPVSGATGYTWTLPSGWTGTSTTSSISVTTGTASGTISVKANNACGSSPLRTLAVTVNLIPAQPATISGNASVCPATTLTYNVAAVSGAISYTWTLPSGWIGSSTTNSINVTAGSSAGNITVKANNACGSGAVSSLAITISTNAPAQPAAITGTVYGLCGQISVPYSVPAVAGVSYNWALPAGATVVSGQGTNSIIANFATASVVSGNVAVSAANACGASSQRKKAVKTTPANPVSITGSTSVCPNSNGNAYSTAPVATATSYIWTGPGGSHVSDGITTSVNNILTTSASAVTINYGAVNSASRVTVKANNACGNSSAKAIMLTPVSCREGAFGNAENATSIAVYPNPAHQVVTLTINAPNANEYTISLIDMTGKTVFADSKKADQGENRFNYSLAHFAKGFYILRVQSVAEVKFSRLDIQ